MAITSFKFLCFYALVLILYYLVPVFTRKRGQWLVLLAASVIFYVSSGNPALLIYPIAASFITWGLLKILPGPDDSKIVKRRVILALELLALLGVLVCLKYI